VQRVGLTPDILLSKAMAGEKEANLPESLPSYRGPDVRDLARVGARPWPSHHGRLGPCSDGGVCRALWRLGGATLGTRAQAARRVTSRAVVGSVGRP
jgi:carboxyl-terminal processing protease